MSHTHSTTPTPVARLTKLVYELLDAHADTMRLGYDTADESGWAAHLDYLRDLQRVGRETLAHAACGD